MTIKLSSMKTNVAKERDGDWIKSVATPGMEWLLRSPHYGPFKRARDLLVQKLGRRRGVSSDEDFNERTNREFGMLYAEHLVLGWRGIDEPYSKELAIEFCTADDCRLIYDDIMGCANLVGVRELEYVEESAKNSEPRSATG